MYFPTDGKKSSNEEFFKEFQKGRREKQEDSRGDQNKKRNKKKGKRIIIEIFYEEQLGIIFHFIKKTELLS